MSVEVFRSDNASAGHAAGQNFFLHLNLSIVTEINKKNIVFICVKIIGVGRNFSKLWTEARTDPTAVSSISSRQDY